MTISSFSTKGGPRSPSSTREPSPRVVGISSDMEAFAKEVADIHCGDFYSGPIIYQRTVCHDKYGKRLVTVVPNFIARGGERENCASADVLAGNINLFLVPNKILDRNTLVSLIEHELVHIFDPKLNQRELRNKPWGINESDARGELDLALSKDLTEHSIYLRHPWEVDAYMATSSISTVRAEFANTNGVPATLARLGKYQPTTPCEHVWKEDPKLWRRYLKTLYATALQLCKRVA